MDESHPEFELYTIEEFANCVDTGVILPGIDGSAYWGKARYSLNIPTSEPKPPTATHVWYYSA